MIGLGLRRSLLLDVYRRHLFPAGDALDYICVHYTDTLKGTVWSNHGSSGNGRQHGDRVHYIGGFILANEAWLNSSSASNTEIYKCYDEETDAGYAASVASHERIFSTLLKILQVMKRSQGDFRALHAFVFRPWYLAVMHQIITRHLDQVREKDHNGNLPLHLFLKFCIGELLRAIEKGYAEDKKDYYKAVGLCFGLLFDANQEAARLMNGEGSFPLILAIQYCNVLKHSSIVEPILNVAPKTLLAQDVETRLHPFALAAVGVNANLDTSFFLLRQNPFVLSLLGVAK